MGFMSKLLQTYDSNIHMAGKADGKATLSLVAHMTANAQLEITIDGEGNFVRADPVGDGDSTTIIPVTESSAARSSGVAPHPLCDQLPYISGDFTDYLADKKEIEKSKEKFEKYFTALEAWALSDFSHPKVQAIYKYIQKKRVMSDLIQAEIVQLDENGKLSNKKINGKEYAKVLVRFNVLGDMPTGTWQDPTLFEVYSNYYTYNQQGIKDICFITGRTSTVSENHPKGIIASNYGAKLISSNDSSNFVYRGRFETPTEAHFIGYEATQKAHAALTWLAAKQGFSVGKKERRTFICWNPKGKEIMDLSNPFGFEEEEDNKSYTEEIYKQRLKDTINGYKNKLDSSDDIVVIALDAATPGRLSVTYYNELMASDFYDRIQRWYETCCWYFTKFTQDKKPYLEISTPPTKQIVNFAFGTERGAFVEADDKVLKEQYQRIISCILDSKPVPRDIVHALALRASTPTAYSYGNHEKLLSIACAMIRKYYIDKGVIYKMKLDTQNTERSYVFGRLLAVLEHIEDKAMIVKYAKTGSSEDRDTHAMRYMSAFSNRPLYTFKIIRENIKPYLSMLSSAEQNKYNSLISELFGLIANEDENKLNQPLNETYLIGYYLQRSELKNKKSEEVK